MPSKHVNAGPLIRRGLYDDLRSFAELENRIGSLEDENSKVVGDAFEVFIEGYLSTHQKMQAESVWPVGQVPLEIRQTLNLPNNTTGIDGIFRTRTGTLVPYQVKFRSERAYLTYTELAPFLGLTERATDRIVFTNSNELAEDVKNRDAMRTVRGIDFDSLTEDDFTAISAWLHAQPAPILKLTPYPYQIEALAKINETLSTADRAHVVMACGTGKTLVALWATEALKPKTVLVLVPSLTLLQQTVDEWSRHNNWGHNFLYMCVCSDPSVATTDDYDPIHLDATDLDFHVDTDPDVVRRFLKSKTTATKVIFATYHSSPIVSEGACSLSPIDVAIFDEAHKTTGLKGRAFAHCLSDENIKIQKRLFFTATPRHYDIRNKKREGDFQIVSMDGKEAYGPRAYTLTFGAAARQGIICNYKVVISIVDGKEVNDFALKHGITLVAGDLIGARWVANQIAVERAVKQTTARHTITFHSRVSTAKEFATDGPRGVKYFLPEFSVFHVNGLQRSSKRKQQIGSFRNAADAIITNARCLTEGIDVPAVDMVAFIDPQHSKIDVAQAMGRAMRKVRGSDKSTGYVVIPLFLNRLANETLEHALARTEFDDVASVLNAIEEVDEEIVETISELMQSKGRGAKFDPQPLADKITVLGPTIDLTTLQTNIFIEIVEALGSVWDEMYGRLVAYYKDVKHTNDKALDSWVAEQRRKRSQGLLTAERIEKLDQIGFNWKDEDFLKPAFGQTQETFENLALSVLRGVGRPMRSGEIIDQFRKRGHQIPGNEVRTAWNRLWKARAKGILTHHPKFGYWIAGEPLSEEAKQAAVVAARARPKRPGPHLVALMRGRKKGRPRALSPKDIRRAEELLLTGKSRVEVATILGISQPTIAKYIPGGITGLKTRYPDVVIPKRPYVSRPRRPGAKPTGRPPSLTPAQAKLVVDMRARGESVTAIATLAGVRRGTIYEYLKKAKAAAEKQNADSELTTHSSSHFGEQ